MFVSVNFVYFGIERINLPLELNETNKQLRTFTAAMGLSADRVQLPFFHKGHVTSFRLSVMS